MADAISNMVSAVGLGSIPLPPIAQKMIQKQHRGGTPRLALGGALPRSSGGLVRVFIEIEIGIGIGTDGPPLITSRSIKPGPRCPPGPVSGCANADYDNDYDNDNHNDPDSPRSAAIARNYRFPASPRCRRTS